MFFFVRRRVIDINAIWLPNSTSRPAGLGARDCRRGCPSKPACRPYDTTDWWKDNDMQIDHVQTYVIAIDTPVIQIGRDC